MARLDEYVKGNWEHHPLTYGDVVWKGEGSAHPIICQVLPGVMPQHAMGQVQRSLTRFLSAAPELYAACEELVRLCDSVDDYEGNFNMWAHDVGAASKKAREAMEKAHGKKE